MGMNNEMTFEFPNVRDAKGFTEVFAETVREGKTVRFPADGYIRRERDIVIAIADDFAGKLVKS